RFAPRLSDDCQRLLELVALFLRDLLELRHRRLGKSRWSKPRTNRREQPEEYAADRRVNSGDEKSDPYEHGRWHVDERATYTRGAQEHDRDDTGGDDDEAVGGEAGAVEHGDHDDRAD